MSKKKQTDQANVEQPTSDCVGAAGAEAEAVVIETEPEAYTLTAEEFAEAQKHISALQKEKDEAVALLQRLQADFDNFRRRNGSVRADSLEEGKRECIKALLPVLDNFDRTVQNDCAAHEAWQEGVKLVQRQLMETLTKLGMSEVETEGKFDPNLHEAVMQEPAEGKDSGEVLAVLQKGYRVGDKIIRHSMVKVAQ